MYVWLRAYYIKRRLTEFVKIDPYIDAIKELSADESIPKYGIIEGSFLVANLISVAIGMVLIVRMAARLLYQAAPDGVRQD